MEIRITDPDGNVFDTITVPDEVNGNAISDSCEIEFNGLLNPSFCLNFREAINSSSIFSEDPKYMANYHLSCAVMDRLDTCIEKLNKYSDYPDSEEDFLVFMMFASMVTDAVKEILAQLGICKKKDPIYNSDEDYKYFREAYLNSSIFNPNAAIPTDEEFFQHFRSLSFAHPVETSRQKFLRKGETQYSPWVIVNRDVMRHRGYEDAVGVRIYSSLEESILDFIISFAVIKDYVRSRYERISLATKWVYEQIEATKAEWKTQKINRNQTPLEMLKEISKTLETRCETNYSIEELVRYMECELTDISNETVVNIYRGAISNAIPDICDAVDDLDHSLVGELCDKFFEYPQKMHTMAGYQLEKIFCNLGDNGLPSDVSNAMWGLKQAKNFSEGFAKKWVNIDVEKMSHIEIQLLVRVACFMEKNEQEK